MRLAAVQTRPEFGDVGGNVTRALRQMSEVEADLYVLPELFTTGYLFTSRKELASMAEPIPGATVTVLMDFTRARGCAVMAGLPEVAGDRIYNGSVLVDRGDVIAKYRKLHLFKKEKEIFDVSPDEPQVVEAAGAKLGLMICFDWVFPEMARTLSLNGAQVLCHPSNLVLPFCQRAMVTRSIENGVFTVLTNRVGEDSRGGQTLRFTGSSEIVGPRGEILAKASATEEEVIVAEIDPALAEDKWITPENHLFEDRRPDRYGLK